MEFTEKIQISSRRNESRIVLALDIKGPIGTRVDRAISKLTQVQDKIAAVKINQQLLLPFGLSGLRGLISECGERQIPVVADMKLNDIESTNMDAVESLFGRGVDAVIANPFVGFKEGLGKVIARSKKLGKGVILLVYMSHAGSNEGYGLRLAGGETMSELFARRVREWDAAGAIVSARSLSKIREVRRMLRKEQLILSPGVGAQGGDAASAIRAGSDFVIVGRSIIDSKDPSSAAQRLNESVRGTLS